MFNSYFKEIKKQIIPILQKGGIGVLPTDTLYGLVGSALNKNTIERIYGVRRRELNKAFIVLIGSFADLESFGIGLNKTQLKKIKKYWPGKISFIFPLANKKFFYLHRGQNSLAFRIPGDKDLLKILKHTGPLVAPSANLAGFSAAIDVKEAEKYFGDKIDFYVDAGRKISSPSTLAQIDEQGNIVVLRKGAVKV